MNIEQKRVARFAACIPVGVLCSLATSACGSGPSKTTDASAAEEAGTVDSGAMDAEPLPLPTLRPISSTEAVELARYVRSAKTEDTGRFAYSVAWSMVNQACDSRAELVNWTIATSPESLAGAVGPVVSPADLTQEKIGAVVASPTRDAAIIHIAGPLIAEQTLIDPDGKELVGNPQVVTWYDHMGAVVNVEGTMKVMDLSIGDTPIDIDSWLHSFISPQQPCFLMEDAEFKAVLAYWLFVTSSLDLGMPRPPRVCGYQIYPLLQVQGNRAPASLEDLPSTLGGQNSAFQTVLTMKYGLTTTLERIPAFLSRYRAKTESDLFQLWKSN
jgi:hypothetical protein